MERVLHLFGGLGRKKKIIIFGVFGFFVALNLVKFISDWHLGPRRVFDPNKVAGKVVEIKNNNIVVKNVFGEMIEVGVSENTKISKGSKEILANEILPGQFILSKVTLVEEKKLNAIEIKILEDARKPN